MVTTTFADAPLSDYYTGSSIMQRSGLDGGRSKTLALSLLGAVATLLCIGGVSVSRSTNLFTTVPVARLAPLLQSTVAAPSTFPQKAMDPASASARGSWNMATRLSSTVDALPEGAPRLEDTPTVPVKRVTLGSAAKGVASLAAIPAMVVAVFFVRRGFLKNPLPGEWPNVATNVIADPEVDTESESREIFPHLHQEGNLTLAKPSNGGADPWKDAPWKDMKWTVYRGVAYDLQPFFDAHPGGSWLLNLAIKRDCTCLMESYHLRLEVAKVAIARLPEIPGFPVEAVPKTPYPGDSALYAKIKARMTTELFKGGGRGIQRTGSMDAAATTTLSFFAAGIFYAMNPCIATGCLFGLTGAWAGMVTQHPGNHGSLSNNPIVNNMLGLVADLVGGSGLCWQYHHNVSHHVHCNDEIMDEDVYSAYPILRLDDRLPQKWYHKYQHLYMWGAFCLMHLAFFFGDFVALTNRRTEGAAMHGVDWTQRGILLLLKVAHVGLLLGLPAFLHGSLAVAIPGAIAYSMTWGLVLAILFAVSHNTNAQKDTSNWNRGGDWAVQQIITSADWGGSVSSWMTGGLSLQVVHHLFPAISAAHYPAIRNIVEEECAKAGVPYVWYPNLGGILKDFVIFMRDVGRAPFRASSPAV